MLTYVWGQAGSGNAVDVNSSEIECQNCHPAFQEAWGYSAHGLAATEPIFTEAWQERGKPKECLACHTTGYDPLTGNYVSEGVTCEACHNPIPPEHPERPIPVDRTAELCGICHTDTYFEWQVSRHGQVGLACISCHGAHSADVRMMDVSELCASCHGTRASRFAHSEHHAQGLTCVECHLGSSEEPVGMGSSVKDHTFSVNLDTCMKCHNYQVHTPPGMEDIKGREVNPEVLAAMVSSDRAAVSSQPASISPIGYATLAGLVGMAFGMITSPWLERWYRRFWQDRS
ncbi:MAG: multiheme c-type cytochrome [Chloroflexota bacterium]